MPCDVEAYIWANRQETQVVLPHWKISYDRRFWYLLYLAWHAIFKQRCLADQPYLMGRIIVESLFELFCINPFPGAEN